MLHYLDWILGIWSVAGPGGGGPAEDDQSGFLLSKAQLEQLGACFIHYSSHIL